MGEDRVEIWAINNLSSDMKDSVDWLAGTIRKPVEGCRYQVDVLVGRAR